MTRKFNHKLSVAFLVIAVIIIISSIYRLTRPEQHYSSVEGSTVSSVAIDPVTPTTLYAGTMIGVFKSMDGGEIWELHSTGQTDAIINALVIDPVRTTTIYAGTGYGILKSTDAGVSWNAINTGLPVTYVNDLKINPQIPSILYVAVMDLAGKTLGGIFKTTDGGTSWSATGLTNADAGDIVINPLTPDTLYTIKAVPTAGDEIEVTTLVYKSTDGGQNWVEANRGLAGNKIHSLAIDPITPETLYAGTFFNGVFKSVDGGATWKASGTGITSDHVYTIIIDPATPTNLYAGTLHGIFVSTDGGASWNPGPAWFSVYTIAIDPLNPTIIYGGQPTMGLYKSIDGGKTWTVAWPDRYRGSRPSG